MSDAMKPTCNHHYHVTGSGVDHRANRRWTTYRCCHCGDEYERHSPLYTSGGTYVDDQSECGPFAPDTQPWF